MPVRILIADDNSFVRKTVRKLLETPGREVIEAENGQQAISLAREHRPQLAVFDLAMPGMDGLTAARHVHNDLPELPILMYTMHWSSQLEVEAIKSGVRKVIAKADSGALVAAVDEVLEAVATPSIPSPVIFPLPPDPAAVVPAAVPAEASAAELPALSESTTDGQKGPLPEQIPEDSV